jgi:hypothetical protein
MKERRQGARQRQSHSNQQLKRIYIPAYTIKTEVDSFNK